MMLMQPSSIELSSSVPTEVKEADDLKDLAKKGMIVYDESVHDPEELMKALSANADRWRTRARIRQEATARLLEDLIQTTKR